MLVAIAAEGFRRTARIVTREDGPFECPECSSEVILKAGRIIVPHFAHRAQAACTWGEGESERHMLMKHYLQIWFPKVELEVRLGEMRRADAVITTAKGNRFVIECQASPISVAEWVERNSDYNDIGLPVAWLWDLSRFNLTRGKDKECAVPAEIRECAAQWRDDVSRDHYVYVFDTHRGSIGTTEGRMGRMAIRPAVREDQWGDLTQLRHIHQYRLSWFRSLERPGAWQWSYEARQSPQAFSAHTVRFQPAPAAFNAEERRVLVGAFGAEAVDFHQETRGD